MTLLPTETVVFTVSRTQGEDDFGSVVTDTKDVTVAGCLVEPVTATELTDSGLDNNLRTTVRVHLPSLFHEDVDNAVAIIRGKRFTVTGVGFGVTVSPLMWDRAATCVLED